VTVEYRTVGGVTREFPADTWSLAGAGAVCEVLPGWEARTSDARRLADLPRNARAYLDRIEELTGAPIGMVSVGSKRTQIIHVS
jgi:adenylosuccinate synthase